MLILIYVENLEIFFLEEVFCVCVSRCGLVLFESRLVYFSVLFIYLDGWILKEEFLNI